MKEYRHRARLAYREVVTEIVTEIHFSARLDNDFVACRGLQIRLAAFYRVLCREGILIAKSSGESQLWDMKNSLSEVGIGDYEVKHCRHRCPANCSGCDLNFRDFIDNACGTLKIGTTENCRVCLRCFQQREFNFWHERGAHNDAVVAQ